MKSLLASCSLLLAASPAIGQWPSDPATNLLVAGRVQDQTIPKIRAAADGSVFVCWLDNHDNGYDPRIQRYDASALPQWGPDGVLIANTGHTSTEDWGLELSASDDAHVVFRDNRAVPSINQITLQRFDSAGVGQWGAQGVTVSTGNGPKYSPRIAVNPLGGAFAGWTIEQGLAFQRVDAAGVPVWTAGGVIRQDIGRFNSLMDLKATPGGDVIALWMRAGAVNPTNAAKHLYAQKYRGSDGAPLWTAGGVIVHDATWLQNGFSTRMVSDEAGGVIVSWYEIGMNRRVYVQHLLDDGTQEFGAGGVPAALTANRAMLDPSVAYDVATDEIVVAWPEETVTGLREFGLRAQKFSPSGARLWGDDGVEIMPLGQNQKSFVRTIASGGGAIVAWFDARSPSTQVVLACGLAADGSRSWPGGGVVDVCSFVSGKSRLDATRAPSGAAVLAFADNRSGWMDIYAQVVQANGTLGGATAGGPAPCPADFNGVGGATVQDIYDFLSAWSMGCP